MSCHGTDPGRLVCLLQDPKERGTAADLVGLPWFPDSGAGAVCEASCRVATWLRDGAAPSAAEGKSSCEGKEGAAVRPRGVCEGKHSA